MSMNEVWYALESVKQRHQLATIKGWIEERIAEIDAKRATEKAERKAEKAARKAQSTP